jgi:hypothetical protein
LPNEEIAAPQAPLLLLLRKKSGSQEKMRELLEEMKADLGLGDRYAVDSQVLAGMVLIKMGMEPGRIAKELTWGEFEDLCANILRASGFRVRKNVILKRPRRQIDIIADSSGLVLSIDCKHWKKSAGGAALQRFAENQLHRTQALRRDSIDSDVPIASLILTMSEEAPRFVGGVAIVSLFLLRSFLNSCYEFSEYLNLV